jgi:hypothetical protein
MKEIYSTIINVFSPGRWNIHQASVRFIFVLCLLIHGYVPFINAQFTAGRIVAVQTSGSVSKAGSAMTLNEYVTDGTPGTTVAIPSTGTTALQMAGGPGGSEGFLTRSTDGSFLVFGGYLTSTAAIADITATTATAAPRTLVKVDYSGNYSVAYSSTTFYSANDIRAGISDGSNYWAAGASTATDGINYYGPGTQVALAAGAKAYGLKIFGGQIYFSTQKVVTGITPNFGIYALGSGLPVSGTITPALVINTGTTATPEDFSFKTSLDICYIAINLNSSTGGIQKWIKSSGIWSLAYTLGTGVTNIGAYALVVDYSGTNPVIYATTNEANTTGNRIIKIVDSGSSSTATTLVTGAANTWFHGIAFTPQPLCTTPVQPGDFTASTSTVNQGQTGVTYTVPNDASATYHWTYSGTGASIDETTNSVTVNFSATATSGTMSVSAVTACGTSPVRSLSITVVPSNYPPTIALDIAATSNYLDGGTAIAPVSPFSVSGVMADPTDAAANTGLFFTIGDAETAASNLTVTATSSNTTVVPNANIRISGTGASRNMKIIPAAVGYSTITVTVNDGSLTTSYLISYAASAASATPANTFWHTGMSDASDGIVIDDNYFISGDDELNVLNVYARSNSGLPLVSYNYTSSLNLPNPSKPEVDIEAATKSTSCANRVYWLGSMSNNSSFQVTPNRDRIFATSYSGSGAATTFAFVGYASLRVSILSWGDSNGYNFTASAAEGVDSKLVNGFAAEGMVFGPDNTTLYIGLRAPLVPTATRKNAVIAPIANFETWFNNGAPSGNPTFGSPIELDLGGRGIRDIIHLANGTYIILAGNPTGSPITSAIYKWTGNAADAPILVTSSANAVLNMEGVMPINNAGILALDKLQIISDGGGDILYNDGTESKDFGELSFRKFRSDVVTGIDLSLPQTITFAALNTKTYGDVTFTVGATGGASGNPVIFTSSDNSIATCTGTNGTMLTILKAGTITVTANQAGNDIYAAAPQATQNLIINKASLDIIANDATRKQGVANPKFTFSYTGFKNNDNASSLEVLPIAGCAADLTSAAGVYNIVVSGGSDKNYTFALHNGKLTITTATAVAQVVAASVDPVLYPTPATDYVNMDNLPSQTTISIFNLQGISVLTVVANGSYKADVSRFSPGVYIVKLSGKNLYKTCRFVKQ